MSLYLSLITQHSYYKKFIHSSFSIFHFQLISNMQRILILLCFLLCSIGIGVNAQKAIQQSNPPSLVVDNANILTPEQKTQLERKLISVDDSSSNQIAVLIVSTLNDQSIEEVANATFRSWGIGNKKTNNGVLLLVAINDKKVRIEVGSGLEGAIPDVTTKDIIENEIVPNFKDGNYYKGIDEATDQIAKAAIGEYKIQKDKIPSENSSNGSILIFIVMIAIVIIIVTNSRGGGGGSMWLAAPLLFGSGGFGGTDDNSSGGFGGDSGGDFGGFGGGDSGGGGASGDW